MEKENLPVIVGIGEICAKVPEDLKSAHSIVDLAALAAERACEDALSTAVLAKNIDAIAVARTFSDSILAYGKPFGVVKNLPRAIGKRIHCNPRYALYEHPSGTTPQTMVTEFSNRIASGEFEVVLIVGGEDIANTKAAIKAKIAEDRADDVGGQLEDRGVVIPGIISSQEIHNDLTPAITYYSMLDNARRKNLNLSRDDYKIKIGEMFQPFSGIAAAHDCAMFPREFTVEEIAVTDEDNPSLTDLYTKAMVAKDRVNQAAAVILTSEKKARELGIDESKWIYPHSSCTLKERILLERENPGRSPAAKLAYQTALKRSGMDQSDIRYFDIYSCFPIAVFAVCDALGIEPDDPRGLTVTGGLPFFGGPGSSYSLFGIVNVARKLRENRTAYGLVGANGGYLSKLSVGVYSAKRPAGWGRYDDSALQIELDSLPAPRIEDYPEGEAEIITYVVAMKNDSPERGFIMGRLVKTGDVFLAATDPNDTDTPRKMLETDPFGAIVFVTSYGPGNRFTFSQEATLALVPPKRDHFRKEYEFCKVRINGHVLEITINRPEVKNALHPFANEELEEIFNIYLSNTSLWVAILTGAGDDAFCAGNDLKYSATGKKVWVPVSGFGGLTHRHKRTKPVIAAVNGIAMGGGTEIALACDLIVASDNAVFALPEVKVGMIAGVGGIQRLTRQIPLKKAMEIILTGKRISAKEAFDLGLVNRIAPKGQAMEKARGLASELLEGSPLGISCSLEMWQEGNRYGDVPTALSQHSKAIDRLITGEDHREGVMAFVEKRKPDWKGW
jgi:acetyl-CoA C-acetyltransferase